MAIINLCGQGDCSVLYYCYFFGHIRIACMGSVAWWFAFINSTLSREGISVEVFTCSIPVSPCGIFKASPPLSH